ncbi:MarR family winged helix-turn-helix transcriptional regulator [Paenibacillus protaetiae]|nr:MarR family transcriptional regulator [Paenibacillus protaetiae]
MKCTSLDTSIGYLLGITYRKLSNLLQLQIKSLDMTPEQWSVLYRISEREGMIQKEIGERAGKDKPTTTRILDLLEGKGYIYRTPGEQDKRSFQIYATEAGKQVIRTIAPIEMQMVEDASEGLSAEQYEQLLDWIRQIDRNVDRLTEKLRGEIE